MEKLLLKYKKADPVRVPDIKLEYDNAPTFNLYPYKIFRVSFTPSRDLGQIIFNTGVKIVLPEGCMAVAKAHRKIEELERFFYFHTTIFDENVVDEWHIKYTYLKTDRYSETIKELALEIISLNIPIATVYLIRKYLLEPVLVQNIIEKKLEAE